MNEPLHNFEDEHNELDASKPSGTPTEAVTDGNNNVHLEQSEQNATQQEAVQEEIVQEMNTQESEGQSGEMNDLPAEEATGEESAQANATNSSSDQKPKAKSSKKTFIRKHRNGLVLTGCFLLAGAGGFGGTMVAMNMSGSSKTVLYQSVDGSGNTSSDTTEATSMSVKDVASKVAESVVEIKTESVSTNDFYQQAVTSGAGSGVIISSDGYIVTNNHVIEDANKVTVTLKDGTSYTATLIGTDSTTDLAVIKIDATGLTPAVLGSSSTLEVGDTAIAIGNPLGSLGGTVTNGIISALDREITIDNQSMHLLQTNAAINPGNSGGGLFNANGELIGVVNAKSSGSDIEGLGFAIPIDIAKPVIESIIENGYVSGRPELGVSLQNVSSQSNPFSNSESKTYVYNASVTSGKAADAAGLKRGDKILEVDGEEVSDVAEVKSAVSSHKAGDTMTFKIERDGEQKTISVTLQEATNTTTEKTNYNSSNTTGA